jgi:hypothetical protein
VLLLVVVDVLLLNVQRRRVLVSVRVRAVFNVVPRRRRCRCPLATHRHFVVVLVINFF